MAISLDIRSLDFIENIEKIINTIDGKNTWNMMFLDAEDDILIKRYKETRRKHHILCQLHQQRRQM